MVNSNGKRRKRNIDDTYYIKSVRVYVCVCVCSFCDKSLQPCVNDVTTDVSIRNIGVRRYTVSAHSSWIPAVPLLLLFHSLL